MATDRRGLPLYQPILGAVRGVSRLGCAQFQPRVCVELLASESKPLATLLNNLRLKTPFPDGRLRFALAQRIGSASEVVGAGRGAIAGTA